METDSPAPGARGRRATRPKPRSRRGAAQRRPGVEHLMWRPSTPSGDRCGDDAAIAVNSAIVAERQQRVAAARSADPCMASELDTRCQDGSRFGARYVGTRRLARIPASSAPGPSAPMYATHEWPSTARSWAQAIPAGPPPLAATRSRATRQRPVVQVRTAPRSPPSTHPARLPRVPARLVRRGWEVRSAWRRLLAPRSRGGQRSSAGAKMPRVGA